MAGHEDTWALTSHMQTHPNLYPLAGDGRPLTLLKRGCANSGQMGFRGKQYFRWTHCASTRRILEARASKMATLGISSALCFITVFRSLVGHASAGWVSHKPCFRQAHCFVRGLCASSLCPQISHAPAPTFGAFQPN